MEVDRMNGKQLAEEVIKRYTEPDGSLSDDYIWIGDCQKRFGKLDEDEREVFLNTLPKELGGRKE